MFKPAAASEAGRGGLQKHQRAKGRLLARAATDEMKNDGERNSERTSEEQWSEERHEDLQS